MCFAFRCSYSEFSSKRVSENSQVTEQSKIKNLKSEGSAERVGEGGSGD